MHEATPATSRDAQDGGRPVVVVGNGPHSRACIDAWDRGGDYELIGCTGPDPEERSELPYLGTDDVIPDLVHDGVRHAFVAIGGNALREKVSAQVAAQGLALAPLVAPTARVAPTATLGPGCIVLHGAVVGAFAEIGAGAIVNTGATVDHDCRIGEFAHLAPGVHLAGTVTVGARAFLGVGVSVIPEITIGADAVVGAGAAVVHDIPAGVTAYGVPARAPRKATTA